MKRALTLALSLSLLASTAAMADSRHDRDRDRNEHSQSQHWDRGDHDRHGRYKVKVYHPPRGYVVHQWRRGERLPSVYRGRTYIVNDYNVYRLRPPPRGYHWVRVNNDVVLAAIAGGIVADVVYNLFY